MFLFIVLRKLSLDIIREDALVHRALLALTFSFLYPVVPKL